MVLENKRMYGRVRKKVLDKSALFRFLYIPRFQIRILTFGPVGPARAGMNLGLGRDSGVLGTIPLGSGAILGGNNMCTY